MAALVAFLSIATAAYATEPKDTARVYVCTGSMAYAYHTHRECRGLNRCTATIKQTTAKAARKEGRKFCGICSKTFYIGKEGAPADLKKIL